MIYIIQSKKLLIQKIMSQINIHVQIVNRGAAIAKITLQNHKAIHVKIPEVSSSPESREVVWLNFCSLYTIRIQGLEQSCLELIKVIPARVVSLFGISEDCFVKKELSYTKLGHSAYFGQICPDHTILPLKNYMLSEYVDTNFLIFNYF